MSALTYSRWVYRALGLENYFMNYVIWIQSGLKAS